MSFAELFTESNIVRDLTGATREACFRELLDVLVASKSIDASIVEPCIQSLESRERIGSTGIGNGVAVPHVKLEAAKGLAVALGIRSGGLDFRAIDGERVQIVFMIVRSTEDQAEHLRFLQWISRLGRNRDFRRFLLGTRTSSEVMALLHEMSEV